jgi:hypothetical protein
MWRHQIWCVETSGGQVGRALAVKQLLQGQSETYSVVRRWCRRC